MLLYTGNLCLPMMLVRCRWCSKQFCVGCVFVAHRIASAFFNFPFRNSIFGTHTKYNSKATHTQHTPSFPVTLTPSVDIELFPHRFRQHCSSITLTHTRSFPVTLTPSVDTELFPRYTDGQWFNGASTIFLLLGRSS